MTKLLVSLWQEEEGQDLVEYGLLLVLVSLGAVAAMGTLASAVVGAFGNTLASAVAGAFGNSSSNLSSS
jgi:Flp pilus assembly pilin Flp